MHNEVNGSLAFTPQLHPIRSDILVSHSTPEAELVAADYGLRTFGLPALSLWRVLCPHQPPLLFHEDNQAMIRVVTTGKNPTMGYLARTHRA